MPRGQISDLKGMGSINDLQPIQEAQPGSEPVLDEQHPDLGWWDRTKVMNLADSEDVGERYLKGQGFETQKVGSWDWNIRKPGEKEWHKVDSSKTEWSDITDIGGDVARGVGGAVGGIIGGTAGGTAGSIVPGAGTAAGVVGGAVGGAALGSGTVQAGLSALGSLSGMRPTTGDVLYGVGSEAALGAAGELGGRAVGAGLKGVGRALQAPLRVPGAIAEKMTLGNVPGAMEAKASTREGLTSLLKEAQSGSTELGKDLAQGLPNKSIMSEGIQSMERPLTSMKEVKTLAEQVRMPLVKKMAGEIGQAEGTAKSLQGLLKQTSKDVAGDLSEQGAGRFGMSTAEKEAARDHIDLVRRTLDDALYNLTEATAGGSKGATARMTELGGKGLDQLGQVEKLLQQHPATSGLEQLLPEGLGNWSTARQGANQMLSEINKRVYKGGNLNLGMLGNYGVGTLRGLAGPGAIAAGTMMGGMGAGLAVAGGAAMGMSAVGKGMEKLANTGLGNTLGRISKWAQTNPRMTSVFSQGLSPSVKGLFAEWQNKGYPITEAPRTKTKYSTEGSHGLRG